MPSNEDLVFLKLGGSLITDKNQAQTVRQEVLLRLASEITAAREGNPNQRLLIGHGSGSFGHVAAKKHGTRQGVHTPADWLGFVEVWKAARALNQIVLEALQKYGLPVIAFPPSAAVSASNRRVLRWDTAPIQSALDAGLIPLVNGDTIFDAQLGGTILSTEDLFVYLASVLQPSRILLAGIEQGVWADFPSCTRLIDHISPESFLSYQQNISESASIDVTGGMLEKVQIMLALSQTLPGFQASIFSGLQPGNLQNALLGNPPGTCLGTE